MDSTLHQLLLATPHTQLLLLVEAVYGLDPKVDQRIEMLLHGQNIAMQETSLKQRIASITRGKEFIDYYQSYGFAMELEALVGDIAYLIDDTPKVAFALIDQLMSTHSRVYERADDSNGDIGGAYAAALSVWIKAASQWRSQGGKTRNWPDEVKKRHDENDYAVWDGVIAQSATLLTEPELQQLAQDFEHEYAAALINAPLEEYNFRAAHAAIGISGVAEALKDVALFERSILLGSPEPNELQKLRIVEFCLSINEAQSALKWLLKPFQHHAESRRQALLDQTYRQLGDLNALLILRREAYQRSPDYHRLCALLEVLPDQQEREALERQAVTNAITISDIVTRIDTLLALCAYTEAGTQVIEHLSSLSVFYGRLIDWADKFHRANAFLAEVACYRLLLDDILSSGRSKAYDHAATYYRKLDKLASQLTSHAPLSEWGEYQEQLKQQHGRKYSFWQRLQ
ncbi:DUF6880 family protein [Pectobacterium sp. CFBP8739]|uniref:DUF6880 family protein n=1 Tax=Pectobacterium sp. CFBP8739 TaxID=2748908 RepID=UPI0015DFC2A0|nr:DUF6880 family protein [Pectobacterium sp. CFBP8739]MBA0165883.1 hypothetical protein [Pectobacterium sp. CFBP8739]